MCSSNCTKVHYAGNTRDAKIKENTYTQRKGYQMNAIYLPVIDKVCRERGINLKISDIVECKVYPENDELFETVYLHCRNDEEMFEFRMMIVLIPAEFNITVSGVKNSPYPCDSFSVIIPR